MGYFFFEESCLYMSDYFIFYTESNIVCLIIFGIMLGHDLLRIDKQEKQIKYDRALIAFMCYFVADAFFSAFISGLLPHSLLIFVIINFANYIFMAAITYMWLQYVMAVEQAPHRNRPINKFAVIFPFLVSLVAMVIVYFAAPQFLFNENLKLQPGYYIFQLAVPIIYIVSIIVYTMRRAVKEKNPGGKRVHLYLGFFPLIIVIGGLVQVLFLPQTSIFCFCCTIFMLIFYIQSMETQISIDPLTNLNNKGQLLRYISQEANLHIENLRTYVIMIDVNDFKQINDRYGHAEGDNALIVIANSLRDVVSDHSMPIFLCRYGGDEFVLIAHPSQEEEIISLIEEIRSQIELQCKKYNLKYIVAIGAGYDELLSTEDTLPLCIQRADQKMYQDKKSRKSSGQTTVCM